jgi:hypothetical protein
MSLLAGAADAYAVASLRCNAKLSDSRGTLRREVSEFDLRIGISPSIMKADLVWPSKSALAVPYRRRVRATRSPSYGPRPKPSSNPKSRKYFSILARLDIWIVRDVNC